MFGRWLTPGFRKKLNFQGAIPVSPVAPSGCAEYVAGGKVTTTAESLLPADRENAPTALASAAISGILSQTSFAAKAVPAELRIVS